jgi:hypothetical protein
MIEIAGREHSEIRLHILSTARDRSDKLAIDLRAWQQAHLLA